MGALHGVDAHFVLVPPPNPHEIRQPCLVEDWHRYLRTSGHALRDVRSQGQSGKHLLALSFSGFDPTRTSAKRGQRTLWVADFQSEVAIVMC